MVMAPQKVVVEATNRVNVGTENRYSKSTYFLIDIKTNIDKELIM